ncbi:hypothetical protein HQ531_14300 [bacterium]|nr:hypothetical protein [bacterium]
MKLTIFNVGHGFCAYLIADTNNVMLFDCGYNQETGFRPSNYLQNTGCNGIENFVISNFDQDHVDDLPNIMNRFNIQVLYRNKSISPERLRQLKAEAGPIMPAMEAAIGLSERYNSPVSNHPDFGAIEFACFYNNYPEFTDTNNLSLVSFIQYDDMGIVLPGDLEKSGWRKLLENESFRDQLGSVNIFVASHHGRDSGYCEEVFEYCSPDIVIISDTSVQYETQKNKYADHASGISWKTGETRYVLTTRSDGNIEITKSIGSGYNIHIG